MTLADGSSTAFELWTQTGTGVYRVIKFGQEVSLSATQNEIYDASRNTITVSPLPPAVHQSEVSRGGDPAAELKRMVESGQTTATATTYNGTPAYKLSVNSSSDPSLNGTAYVARSNYEPLEFDSAADPSGKVVFSAYQYPPRDPGQRRPALRHQRSSRRNGRPPAVNQPPVMGRRWCARRRPLGG